MKATYWVARRFSEQKLNDMKFNGDDSIRKKAQPIYMNTLDHNA